MRLLVADGNTSRLAVVGSTSFAAGASTGSTTDLVTKRPQFSPESEHQ